MGGDNALISPKGSESALLTAGKAACSVGGSGALLYKHKLVQNEYRILTATTFKSSRLTSFCLFKPNCLGGGVTKREKETLHKQAQNME